MMADNGKFGYTPSFLMLTLLSIALTTPFGGFLPLTVLWGKACKRVLTHYAALHPTVVYTSRMSMLLRLSSCILARRGSDHLSYTGTITDP